MKSYYVSTKLFIDVPCGSPHKSTVWDFAHFVISNFYDTYKNVPLLPISLWQRLLNAQ